MGLAFWIRRFVLVWVGAAVVIGSAQLIKGQSLAYSVSHAVLWATLSAGVFTGARIYQSHRGQHCAVCRDTPEMRNELPGGNNAP